MGKKIKSPVSDRHSKEVNMTFWDIENSPNEGLFWHGMYEQDIIEVTEYGIPLSAAYMRSGSKTVHCLALSDYKNDHVKNFLTDMHGVLSKVDILVHHNGDSFDVKKMNTYFVKYGLPPLPPIKTVDTYKVAKKYFKFNSNKLDALADYLGIGRKVKTGGFALWKECMKFPGELVVWAWALMKKYNKGDVLLLEKVYLKLRPWMSNHPKMDLEERPICSMCKHSRVQFRGSCISDKKKHRRFQCQNPLCGHWDMVKVTE
jgi:uncharacterized protein YprB with RNaseH-like and TPR domain